MQKAAKRLILHIGSNKTGSSALQAGFEGARAAMAEQGVCYPRAGIASSAHHLFAAACHPGAWRMHEDAIPEDRAIYVLDLARKMIAEADEAGCSNILLSSEYLWGILPAWSHARLVAAFPGWGIDLLALIRRPEDWAVSCWMQAVKSGLDKDFSTYVETTLSSRRTALDYDKVIGNWEAATRARKTHLILYESVRGDILRKVTKRIGLDLGGAEAPTKNRSPSADEVERLLDINRSDASDLQKAMLRAKIMTSPPRDDAPWVAERAEIRKVAKLARPGLKRLARRQKLDDLYGV